MVNELELEAIELLHGSYEKALAYHSAGETERAIEQGMITLAEIFQGEKSEDRKADIEQLVSTLGLDKHAPAIDSANEYFGLKSERISAGEEWSEQDYKTARTFSLDIADGIREAIVNRHLAGIEEVLAKSEDYRNIMGDKTSNATKRFKAVIKFADENRGELSADIVTRASKVYAGIFAICPKNTKYPEINYKNVARAKEVIGYDRSSFTEDDITALFEIVPAASWLYYKGAVKEISALFGITEAETARVIIEGMRWNAEGIRAEGHNCAKLGNIATLLELHGEERGVSIADIDKEMQAKFNMMLAKDMWGAYEMCEATPFVPAGIEDRFKVLFYKLEKIVKNGVSTHECGIFRQEFGKAADDMRKVASRFGIELEDVAFDLFNSLVVQERYMDAYGLANTTHFRVYAIEEVRAQMGKVQRGAYAQALEGWMSRMYSSSGNSQNSHAWSNGSDVLAALNDSFPSETKAEIQIAEFYRRARELAAKAEKGEDLWNTNWSCEISNELIAYKNTFGITEQDCAEVLVPLFLELRKHGEKADYIKGAQYLAKGFNLGTYDPKIAAQMKVYESIGLARTG